jgi:hypothetical protein
VRTARDRHSRWDREEAAALAPDHRTLVKGTDNLRRRGVDQACGVQLLVPVVLVAPTVGEPLPEPGARDLAAEFGPEAAAGVASAGRHRAFEVA